MQQILYKEVREETEEAFCVEVLESLCLFQRDIPRSEQVNCVHLLEHLARQRARGLGPPRALDMFAPERWHGWLASLRFSSKAPEASIAQRYSIEQTLALATPLLEKCGLSQPEPTPSSLPELCRLHGRCSYVPVPSSDQEAINKLNLLDFPEYGSLLSEFELDHKQFKEGRREFRKHNPVEQAPEYPESLRAFPSTLEEWVVEREKTSLSRGERAFGRAFLFW